jgi:hypothetical protein
VDGHRAEAKQKQCGVRGSCLSEFTFPSPSRAFGVHDNSALNMAPKKPAATAEVALIPLKNCLVNLPSSLVALLVNANTVSLLAVTYQSLVFG